MIKNLTLRNFGPFERVSVGLDDFTVILGSNGTGKSLLFTALKCLGRVAKFPLRYDTRHEKIGGYPTRTGQVTLEDLLHLGDTSRTLFLGVEFQSGGISGTYEVHLKHWQNPAGIIVEEHLKIKTPKGDLAVSARPDGSVESTLSIPHAQLRTPRFVSILGRLFRSRDPNERELGDAIQQALWDRIGLFRFDPTALKTPAEVGRGGLSATGYNFATYLDEIRNSAGGTAEFEALLTRFKTVCPRVEDILLPAVDQPGPPRKRITFAMSTSPKKTIPVDLESDGTILLLAYVSLLHGPRPYETICIEEPENGIHPKVIGHQVEMMRSLTKTSDDRAGVQVLVCTHSRRIFDEMKDKPSALRLVKRAADGRSMVETVSAGVMPAVAAWAGLE